MPLAEAADIEAAEGLLSPCDDGVDVDRASMDSSKAREALPALRSRCAAAAASFRRVNAAPILSNVLAPLRSRLRTSLLLLLLLLLWWFFRWSSVMKGRSGEEFRRRASSASSWAKAWRMFSEERERRPTGRPRDHHQKDHNHTSRGKGSRGKRGRGGGKRSRERRKGGGR